jgi:hypothetical protein
MWIRIGKHVIDYLFQRLAIWARRVYGETCPDDTAAQWKLVRVAWYLGYESDDAAAGAPFDVVRKIAVDEAKELVWEAYDRVVDEPEGAPCQTLQLI